MHACDTDRPPQLASRKDIRGPRYAVVPVLLFLPSPIFCFAVNDPVDVLAVAMVPIQHIADDTGHDRDDKRPPISASSLPRTYASAVTRSSTAQEASCIVPASTPKTDKDVPLDLGLYLTLSDLNAHAGPSSPRSPATPPPVSPGVSRKGKGRALDSVTEEDGPSAEVEIFYRPFRSEQEDMEDIMRLVQAELSEP